MGSPSLRIELTVQIATLHQHSCSDFKRDVVCNNSGAFASRERGSAYKNDSSSFRSARKRESGIHFSRYRGGSMDSGLATIVAPRNDGELLRPALQIAGER